MTDFNEIFRRMREIRHSEGREAWTATTEEGELSEAQWKELDDILLKTGESYFAPRGVQ